jgi:hypothetical protein
VKAKARGLHANNEREDKSIASIITFDLHIEEIFRYWPQAETGQTYSSKFIFKIISTLGREGNMVKVKPDLPEPSAYPAALLASTANCSLMQRWLFPRGIKVDNAQEASLR